MGAPKGKYAWTATVGEKGQIVIPKQAREVFGIRPGDTLLLLGDENRGIAIMPKQAFGELFSAAFDQGLWMIMAMSMMRLHHLLFLYIRNTGIRESALG